MSEICRDFFASVPAVAEERRMGIEVTAVFKQKRRKPGDGRLVDNSPHTLLKKCLCIRVKLIFQCFILYMCVVAACR